MIDLEMSSQRKTLTVGDTSFLFLSSHTSTIGETDLSKQEDNKMYSFPGRGGGLLLRVRLLLFFSECVNYLFLSEVIQQRDENERLSVVINLWLFLFICFSYN